MFGAIGMGWRWLAGGWTAGGLVVVDTVLLALAAVGGSKGLFRRSASDYEQRFIPIVICAHTFDGLL